MGITYEWRGRFGNAENSVLHAQGFDHPPRPDDWWTRANGHSLGWVCARLGGELVGFVNVAWDGADHAFVLDTVVALTVRRRGVGTELVKVATKEARAAGCEWLHVDFEGHLLNFYIHACGFTPSAAGLVAL
jgi:GNAT superfamily N-acetyltransferase